MKKIRPVRYVHIGRTTFVSKDIDILRSEFDLAEYHFKVMPKWVAARSLLIQFCWLIGKGFNTSLFVCQFAGYHSLLPGLFGKLLNVPMIIVASGTESVRYPSISYGNFSKPLFRLFTAASFRLASHVAVVHKSLARSENTYYEDDGKKQGFLNHVSNLTVDVSEIPYGFDPDRWKPVGNRKPNTFLTVAHVWNKVRFTLKGIDLLFDIATHFSDCEFTVIGLQYTPERPIPSNVTVLPAVANSELPAVYSAHEFYLQLSISEGHPNALCEAMLCGCIPVGSTAGAIPDIIGNEGFLVERRDSEMAKEVVSKALGTDRTDMPDKARSRILRRYPLDRRRSELTGLVGRYISS